MAVIDSVPTVDDLVEEIIELLKDDVEELPAGLAFNTPLSELSSDNEERELILINLAKELHGRYSVHLKEDDVLGCQNIGALATLVHGKILKRESR